MLRVKSLCTLIVLCFLFLSVKGQDRWVRFQQLFEKNDTVAAKKLLHDWEVASPKDPELFIAYFNFYIKEGVEEFAVLENQTSRDNSEISDTGNANHIGYIHSVVEIQSINLNKAIDYINKGIALHPKRLDMRFGKIYMLGVTRNYQLFSDNIIQAIDYSAQISNHWLWKEGKLLDSAKEFFLSSLQTYIDTLYAAGDEQLPLMRKIAERVLKYYPNHVESLSNVAITYLIDGKYDTAIQYLERAEKIAPKDVIVLNNIGEAYYRKKDKEKAKVYYQKIISIGSKEDIEDAKEKLKRADQL